MPRAKTSQRAEQRELREKMRDRGMSQRQIAFEFARRYHYRSRAAWRHAHGWSLTEAAEQITAYAAQAGLGHGLTTVAMTSSHLCEMEGWPGEDASGNPVGRRPTPYLLSLLAAVYGCTPADLLDTADYQHLRPADRIVLGKAPRPEEQQETTLGPPVFPSVGELPCQAHPSVTDAEPGLQELVSANVVSPGETFHGIVRANWPGVRLSRACIGDGTAWHAEFPGGRLIDGGGAATMRVMRLKQSADGRMRLQATDDQAPDGEPALARRAMLIGVDQHDGTARLLRAGPRYPADLAWENRTGPGTVVPRAYELDDVTYAIMWAVANLDDALLTDDYALDQRRRELSGYERVPQSAAGREVAAGLTSVARMWLGSSFCARHILRSLARPTGVPVFWTREQRGEEAAVWLLFRHKLEYLRRISTQFTGHSTELARGFCVPEDAVVLSPRWERILLFLAMALMESLGIRTMVAADPGYAEVDGFALLPGEQATVATWVRSEETWHAGVTSSGTALREFASVTGNAAARSVTAAAAPVGRLVALADYLGLDWPWLSRRCAELGTYGCAGIIRPSSRLLSLDGLDTALRYAGTAGRASCD